MAQIKEGFAPNGHLRSEIMCRWEQLTTAEVEECSTDLDKLVDMLQTRYGYARRRAEKEVDLFYGEFQTRVRLAA
jgi:hypothetical protein